MLSPGKVGASVVFTITPPRGDFDVDGTVDARDLAIFAACATGPAIPYSPLSWPRNCSLVPTPEGLIAPDFDRDGDVDQTDFGVFQHCLGKNAIDDLTFVSCPSRSGAS